MHNTVGIVPIAVNVGAAVFPAVIAAVGSVLGVLFRPRELVRLCIRRPLAVLAVLVGAGAIWGAFALIPSSALPAAARQKDQAIDWNKKAAKYIARNRLISLGAAVRPAFVKTSGPVFFRGGPARSGHDGGLVPEKIEHRWSYKLDDTMFLSSPSVVFHSEKDQRVFGAAFTEDPISSFGTIFRLDAATGKEVWRTEGYKDPDSGEDEYFKPFFSSPAVTADGKYMVIGQGLHDDADCALICLRTDTGKLHWRIKTPLHIEGSPAIMGDLVIAGAGAIEGPDGRATGHSGFVFASRIAEGKGKELWRWSVKDPESSPVISPDGKFCYIGSGVGGCELIALRTAPDGELEPAGLKRELWRAGTPYPATGTVTLHGDLVIIGCGRGNYVNPDKNPIGAVIAFNRHSGKEVWTASMPDAVLGAVAVGGQKAVCPVRNGEVVALSLSDGKVLWRSRVNDKSPVLAAPAIARLKVYAVSRDGSLAVMDARDGRVLEKHSLDDESNPGARGLSVSSPAVAGGWVFVGSETGGLHCFAPIPQGGDKE